MNSLARPADMVRYRPFAYIFLLAALSRLSVFGLAWLFNVGFDLSRSAPELLCSADCGWYRTIINEGYHLKPVLHPSGDAANWAFFPLFPLFARTVSLLFGFSDVVSALLVSNVAFVVGLFVLFDYANRLFGIRCAYFTAALFAFSPYSVYFSSPYSESLYFLLMVSSLHCARNQRWILAGLLAAALSATRNLGAFIAIPLLVIGAKQFGWRSLARLSPGTERFWTGIFLAPLGLFVYMLYLHRHVGDAFAFMNVQVAWQRVISNPLLVLLSALRDGSAYDKYCALLALAALATSIYLARVGLAAEAWTLLFATIIPLTSAVWSMQRFAFAIYPPYLAIGVLGRRSYGLQMLVLCALSSFGPFFIFSWVAGKAWMI